MSIEINAASSVSALVPSADFDFRKTYFMVAGIAGVNPEVAFTASVTFARYLVEVALQYEFSQLEIPSKFSTGYFPLGSTAPDEYSQSIYGTEVFEFNTNSRSLVVALAQEAALEDSEAANRYRANYANSTRYAAGAAASAIHECDVATADVYFSGDVLSEAFGNYTALLTKARECTALQHRKTTVRRKHSSVRP